MPWRTRIRFVGCLQRQAKKAEKFLNEYCSGVALDAYEAANKANGHMDARDRIEHIEAPNAQDIPRFGKLGVIASVQPLHATPDVNTLTVWSGNIGPQRALLSGLLRRRGF